MTAQYSINLPGAGLELNTSDLDLRPSHGVALRQSFVAEHVHEDERGEQVQTGPELADADAELLCSDTLAEVDDEVEDTVDDDAVFHAEVSETAQQLRNLRDCLLLFRRQRQMIERRLENEDHSATPATVLIDSASHGSDTGLTSNSDQYLWQARVLHVREQRPPPCKLQSNC